MILPRTKIFDSDPNIARRQRHQSIERAEEAADQAIRQQKKIEAIDDKYIVKEWYCPLCDKRHEVIGSHLQIGGLYPTRRHCEKWKEIDKEMERGKRIWKLKGIWKISKEDALRFI